MKSKVVSSDELSSSSLRAEDYVDPEMAEKSSSDSQKDNFWSTLQEEQGVWSLRNFGIGPKHWPLLGILEELGELEEASRLGDKNDLKDAIADIIIYAADLCNRWGWSLAWLLKLAEEKKEPVGWTAITMGKIAHVQLKYEQKIRGSSAEYEHRLQLLVVEALQYPLHYVNKREYNLEQIVTYTWGKVSKRDWKANPMDADKIAEANG